MRLILLDSFLFVYKPFDDVIKFQFLVQCPVDHLAHSVMCSLELFYTFENFHSKASW